MESTKSLQKKKRVFSRDLVKIGDIFPTNNCGEVEVLQYTSAVKCDVKFINTGSIVNVFASNLRKGTVRDPLHRWRHGVGYLGVGPHKTLIVLDKKKYVHTREYATWSHMLSRCYGSASKRKTNSCYNDVTVCEAWHNFQNFAEWFLENKPTTDIPLHLDKDLKVPGSTQYSPLTCSFVPYRVNSLFTGWLESKKIATGVILHKPTNKYVVKICNTWDGVHKEHHVGTFDSEVEAKSAYILHKVKIVKDVAEFYKNILDPIVYSNLTTNAEVFIR